MDGHNGFGDSGVSDDDFGESNAFKAVKAFDAFPKTKPSYTEQTNSGGIWTIVLVLASFWLGATELGRWWQGETTHTFSVEQGIGHDLQINLDVVVHMRCEDLHVNVQDASGDRILAGSTLHKDPTTWVQWGNDRKLHTLGKSKDERLDLSGYPGFGEYKEEDVHNYLGAAKATKKWKKTPKVPRHGNPDSCRIYGSMEGNKVQGDFHITARGHGYMEMGQHLDHSGMQLPNDETLRPTDTSMQLSTSLTMSTSFRSVLSTRRWSTLWTTPLRLATTTSRNSSTTFLWFRQSTRLTPSLSRSIPTNTTSHLPAARMA
jgi:hypothetical protein